MIRRRTIHGTGFKTSVKKVKIIGGEGEFCAENIGFRQTKDGLEAAYFPHQILPTVSVGNIICAEYLPAHGYAIIYSKYGQLFKWNTKDFSTIKTIGALSSVFPFIMPIVVNGENTYVCISGQRGGIIKKEAFETFSLPFKVFCGAFHCGRVFAGDQTDKYTIRWSGYDFKDWTESIDGGGHLRLQPRGGEIVSIVEMGEKLVVVRRNEICVLRVLGDARHMRLEQTLNIGLPDVTANTCVICAGQLWFVTADGLCSFNGESVKCVPKSEYGFDFVPTWARPFKNRYILFSGNSGSSVYIMEYDTQTGAFSHFAEGYNFPHAVGDTLYCFEGKLLNKLVEGEYDPQRRWISKPVDLGSQEVKTLKYLNFEGDGVSDVTVSCDGVTRTVFDFGRTYIGLRGRNFTFTVNSAGTITDLTAEWEVRE